MVDSNRQKQNIETEERENFLSFRWAFAHDSFNYVSWIISEQNTPSFLNSLSWKSKPRTDLTNLMKIQDLEEKNEQKR